MQLALLQSVILNQSGASSFWLWFTAGGMIIFTVFFLYLATSGQAGNYHHYVTSAVIVLWAGIWYVLMASGSGISELTRSGVGTVPFYFGRYIDWVITTPLLLVGLSWVGLGSLGRASREVTFMVVSDVLMILTGLLAGVTGGGFRWFWFVISCIFFVGVMYFLWIRVRSLVSDAAGGQPGLFYTLSVMLTVLWFLYPIVWILGTEGSGAIGSSVEVFFYAVLDILAKIAFGVILLGGVRRASGTARA